MDNIREEFEEWFSEIGSASVLADTMKDDAGNYYFPETRLLWACWQASRQALVVDVESLPSASYTDGGVVYRSHVESMIESAGVSLK